MLQQPGVHTLLVEPVSAWNDSQLLLGQRVMLSDPSQDSKHPVHTPPHPFNMATQQVSSKPLTEVRPELNTSQSGAAEERSISALCSPGTCHQCALPISSQDTLPGEA